jgi:hypothetical protein
MPTNDTIGKRPEGTSASAASRVMSEHPGYETTGRQRRRHRVVSRGTVRLRHCLLRLLLLYGQGHQHALVKQTARPQVAQNLGAAWRRRRTAASADLTSNAEMQQKELQQMTKAFPTPRLEIDDGNQARPTACARRPAAGHYSSSTGPGYDSHSDRRAMQLIAQRGCRSCTAGRRSRADGWRRKAGRSAPLTNGFARTGYELETIEARKQKNELHGKAEGATQRNSRRSGVGRYSKRNEDRLREKLNDRTQQYEGEDGRRRRSVALLLPRAAVRAGLKLRRQAERREHRRPASAGAAEGGRLRST